MTCPDDPHGPAVLRRHLLWLPVAAGAGALALGAPLRAQEAADAGALQPVDHAAFASRWHALASELKLAPPTADESYAAQLAGLVARVPLAQWPRLEGGNGRNGLVGGPSWRLLPCVTIEFRFEPGASLRLHNHPPQVVLTLGLEGELRFRHFELDGPAPPCTQVDGTLFLVRETRAGLLRPGQSTTLTRVRDGLHTFEAGPQGATLVDFVVGLSDDTSFSYVDLATEPADAARRTWEATWAGR